MEDAERPLGRPSIMGRCCCGGCWGLMPDGMALEGEGTESDSMRFLVLGTRGGTRRLKLATTSGGELRLRVGWAGGPH